MRRQVENNLGQLLTPLDVTTGEVEVEAHALAHVVASDVSTCIVPTCVSPVSVGIYAPARPQPGFHLGVGVSLRVLAIDFFSTVGSLHSNDAIVDAWASQ